MSNLSNPSNVPKPKLKSPLGKSDNPYNKFRRKVLRRKMWGR